ncbi:MAG: hypothetical protein WC763_05430 [Candidatus Paceibacterota bacterium]
MKHSHGKCASIAPFQLEHNQGNANYTLFFHIQYNNNNNNPVILTNVAGDRLDPLSVSRRGTAFAIHVRV